MFNLFKQNIHRGALPMFGLLALFSLIDPSKGSEKAPLSQVVAERLPKLSTWKRFYAVQGACSISLPSTPEHLQQVTPLSREGEHLRYDIYVAPHERKAVYMLLVAQYPYSALGDGTQTEINLENFLNGLIAQSPENRLIFADLTKVQGHKALDFFIQVRGTYFKGRAIVANNTLYLLSMECDKKNYTDRYFKHFIKSFKIKE